MKLKAIVTKATIPVYDICSIDVKAQKDLLVERLDAYLEKHYQHLHRPHRHSFYHLVLFTSGKGRHTIDFEKFTIKPFQIYFMVPGQVHSWHFEGAMEGYIVHFNEVLFTGFLQDQHYLEQFYFFQGKAEDGVCQLSTPLQATVVSLLETMVRETGKGKEQNLDLIRLKLLELFITIDRSRTGRKSEKLPGQKLSLLRSFQRLIDKHYRDIKLPKEYADLLYITPNHLNALTQGLMGKTAGDLIRERVLLEAKRLLTNADRTVTEIAYELNFQDNSYFNRFFKKYEGLTPEEFRKTIIHT